MLKYSNLLLYIMNGTISELLERVEKHRMEILHISESIEKQQVNTEEQRDMKILLAIDGSKKAEMAVNYAISIAIKNNAEVVLLHAIKKNGSEISIGESLVEREAIKIRCYGVDVSTRIEFGDPAEKILKVAEDIGADMIILGIRGTNGLKKMIIGSVSEKVLEAAKIPVFVVR